MKQYDVIVIGGALAGLSSALMLAEKGKGRGYGVAVEVLGFGAVGHVGWQQ